LNPLKQRYVFEVAVTVEPSPNSRRPVTDDDITIAVKNALYDGGFFCEEYVASDSSPNCTVTLIRVEAPAMNEVAEELRRIADIAEAGGKPHWAQAMRAGAMQILTIHRCRACQEQYEARKARAVTP